MGFEIRQYLKSDYPMIHSWWCSADEAPPTETMLPEETTFILEIEGNPALAVSLYLSNCKEVCWVENFVGNPIFKGALRRHATKELLSFLEQFAKRMGYLKLFCMSIRPGTARYFSEQLGFQETARNLTTFIKRIE